MDPTASQIADELEARLREAADPARAEGERAYLKSDLEFIGVTLPVIGRAVEQVASAHPNLDHDSLVALVVALWAKPVFERRMAATLVLQRHRRLLSRDDLPLIERLLRESRTWALVDALAGDLVAGMLVGDPAVAATLDAWSTDADFWIRRSSLLAHLRRVRNGEPLGDFARYADAMLDEREFFIRKAIGWVLRESGKRRPDEVAAWLAPRTHRASGVTMREAVKYLAEPDRERLMYRDRRPLP
jgi:3-methyladenine DNA glycosylase AlkD